MSDEVRCPKCGSDDIWTRYCDGRWIGGERKTGAVNACDRDHDEEQLHRVCRNCQHRCDDPTVSEECPGGGGEGEKLDLSWIHAAMRDAAKGRAMKCDMRNGAEIVVRGSGHPAPDEGESDE